MFLAEEVRARICQSIGATSDKVVEQRSATPREEPSSGVNIWAQHDLLVREKQNRPRPNHADIAGGGLRDALRVKIVPEPRRDPPRV